MSAVALALTTASARATLITDPTGDVFGAVGGAVRPDIVSYEAVVSGTNVVFTVNFAGLISRPSLFQGPTAAAPSVVGFIDIDTDQNAGTGAPPFINTFGGPPPVVMGDEFFINIGSEASHPGTVDVVNAITNVPTGTAPITFGAMSFSVTVALSLLGGDDGLFNYALILGNFTNATDRAPNGATPSQSEGVAVIPEPASLLLLGLGMAGVTGYGWRRRRVA